MCESRSTTATLCLLFILSAVPVSAVYGERSPEYYFGQATPLRPHEVQDVLIDLRRAHRECRRILKPCEPAVTVLKTLFGEIYRKKLPDALVYVEKQGDGSLRAYPPLLIWNGKLTPYVFGARHLYVVVVSDETMSLDVHLTTIVETTSNPFVTVLSLLNFTAPEQKAPEPKSASAGIAWEPLGEDTDGPYLGWARLDIEEGSINRLTVHARRETVSRTVTKRCDGCPRVKVERKSEGPEPLPDDGATVPFRELTAHLSNSRPNFAGFGVSLGATFDVEDSAVGDDGGEVHENAYALAKVFLRRPRLKVGPRARRLYRLSVAFFFGTNVAQDPFEELLAGISVGHVVGKLGVNLGLNWVRPGADDDQGGADGREERFFVGLEYSF